MGRWLQEYSTLEPNSGTEPHRPPIYLQEKELGGSTGSDVSAAPVHDGDSEAGTQQIGGDILAGLLAEEVFSDSGSGFEYDTEEEQIIAEFGEDLWIQEEYLDTLRPPKEMDILLRNGTPGGDYEWMANAPEWHNALGFGSSAEQASEDLQSKLVETKESFIDWKVARGIKAVPLAPCRRDALVACKNWLKSYYERIAKDSGDVKWGKIWV